MNRQTKITISVASLVASFIIWGTLPISLYGPVVQSNVKLDDYKLLSSHIAKFKDNTGRLPRSFEEAGKYSDVHGRFFTGLADKYGTDGTIYFVEDSKIVFEIEAVWEGNRYDNLLWAKTKDGNLIRVPKDSLKQ